jgi:hypothetical protein
MNDLTTLILIDNTAKQEQVTFGSVSVNSVFKVGDAVYLKVAEYPRHLAVSLRSGHVDEISSCQLVFPLKATLTIEKV